MEHLQGLQVEVRHRFMEYVKDIPSHYATISEHTEPSLPEIDWGEMLELEILPADDKRCSIHVSVGKEYAYVYVGKHAEFELDPGYTKETSSYADKISKLIEAVIDGRVSEVVWKLGNKVIRSTTRVYLDSTAVDSGFPIDWLFSILESLKIVRTIEKPYLAYR